MKILFPEFKTKAVTFSYDDGTVEDKWLTDIFRKYNVKATFNINGGLYNDICDFTHAGIFSHIVRIAPEWAKDLYEGFEIAAHGYKHMVLSDDKEAQCIEDITKDLDSHEALFGKRPVGFAYPCGIYNVKWVEILKKFGIKYARTIENTNSFDLPEDFLKWHPTCRDKDALPVAELFASENFDEAKLLYIWGHSFELQKQDMNRYENIENILKTLSGRDDIWYATNGEIEQYISAAKSVIKTDEGYINNSGIKIYITYNGKQIIV